MEEEKDEPRARRGFLKQLWFWVLVAIGLIVTQQLSRRMAIVASTLLCVTGIGVHAGVAVGLGGG